jgi:HAD superfamily hydrolase (TIGR01450 family)
MPSYDRSLKDIKNFIFDLDGTVWHWNQLAPGVKSTIRDLKAKGKNVYYVTNNSLLTRAGLASKLTGLGLKTDEEDVVSSPYVAARTFVEKDIDEVYAIGEQGLSDELENEHITTSETANNVIVGYDRNFTFWKMAKAAELIREGAGFWSTGSANVFHTENRDLPGEKSLTESIRIAARSQGVKQLGKPSEHMIETVRDQFPIVPEKTIMIGDSLDTDVLMGNKMGIRTGLVLGGQAEREDLQDVSGLQVPDYVFEKFERILLKV